MKTLASLLLASLLTCLACAHSDLGPAGDTPAEQFSGLINVAGVKALPSPAFVPTKGYPGHGFHLGVFTDADTFDKFAKAAAISSLDVDWDEQMVVYAVLDAQTNALRFASWSATGDTGTLTVIWEGIEPYYVDSTPAVLAVVARDSLASIDIKTSTLDIGSFTM